MRCGLLHAPPVWLSQALYGITRQHPAAMDQVFQEFMVKIESVHPLLSNEAVRAGVRGGERSVGFLVGSPVEGLVRQTMLVSD